MALTVAGAAAALALPNAATASGPSPSRIRKAVRTAEHSSDLWATINICNGAHHRDELGIRGQMPGLGFQTQMYMTFEVTYSMSRDGRFKRLPSTKATVRVGQTSNRALQVGRTYPFEPSSAWLAARVTFIWKLGARTLGDTTRTTTGKHHHVDFADPRGYSRAVCRIR
jgi:hypothetical protein